MKKMILMLVAAIVCATTTYAQSSMLATLSHEGTISTYYGSSALKDAYAAAVDGDVITLSSGSFDAVNIEKGIVIRGAGCSFDNEYSNPTVIVGDFSIGIKNTNKLMMEGIFHNNTITLSRDIWLVNAIFLKCRFNKFTHNIAATKNLIMINCRVVELDICYNSSASFINCIFANPYVGVNGNYEFYNCVLIKENGFSGLKNTQFKNCILVNKGSDSSIDRSCLANYCIGVGNASRMFNTSVSNTNIIKDYEAVFKTYMGTYSDGECFELIDEAKESLLGQDGTQVGIYGGNMPFDTTPSNPQITKCNVASKSSADGKLSVDITVKGAE